MEAPEACPEQHLAALKRLIVGLEASCVEIVATRSGVYAGTMLLALINLAARGLAPSSLKGGGAMLLEMIAEHFFSHRPGLGPGPNQLARRLQPDNTAFAAHCCAFLSALEDLSPEQCGKLLKALAHHLGPAAKAARSTGPAPALDLLLSIAKDSLATGWAQEYLGESQLATAGNSKANLVKTQFFTPSWIAAYLCQEAIAEKRTFTLLDPACGAGHLLVEAATHAAKGVGEDALPKKLSELFGHSLYGLDVDAALLNLAAFALYLCARDLLIQGNHLIDAAASHQADDPANNFDFVDLPAPNLYCLKSPLGTLALGDAATVATTSGVKVSSSVIPKAFDAIVMNPPYLSTRTMDDTTADYLKVHYQSCAGDLYTAFMQLAVSLLKNEGRLSTVVQQSFLSISRYRTFRLNLLKQTRIISCVQLGTGAFPSRPGEKVNNAIITLQKTETSLNPTGAESQNKEHAIRFLRLQGKADHDLVKASGLANYPHQVIGHDQAVKLIKSLSGQPFAFHCPEEIGDIFAREPSLADLSSDFVLTNGLFTCDNKRFVKLASAVETSERSQFVPYDKGGGQKWYHSTPYLLHWGKNGQAIRDFREERGQSKSLPGESFYFKSGLTYSYIGTKGFSARLLSPGAIFDIASSAVFSLKYDLHYILGFLNSALVAYLLSTLNPTVNFQIGDLRKLPFKVPDPALEGAVSSLAAQAVAIVRIIEEAKGPVDAGGLAAEEREIQKRIDALIFDHYSVGKGTRHTILDDAWVQRGQRLIV